MAFLFPGLDGPAAAGAEVMVIANRRMPAGEELARYYMERRQIPVENLLIVTATNDERVSREEFDRAIFLPARKFLEEKGDGRIRLIVAMYGVPLAVKPPEPSLADKTEAAELERRQKDLRRQRKDLPDNDASRRQLKEQEKELARQIDEAKKLDWAAAVDSELALLPAGDYPRKGWLPNPRFVGPRRPDPAMLDASRTIMVSRLDASSPEVVRRMIDDSLAVEKDGLAGGVYLDARYPAAKTKGADSAYEIYDQLLHRAGGILEKKGFSVRIDDRDELFAAGSGLPAALYCGWYSLGRYIDAFAWRRGAIGYHLASTECATLRGKEDKGWCRNILDRGAAATIGPIGEPYLQSFPPPDLFFGLLAAGDTLAEAYTGSLPFLSWKMVLIGDPLYRPYRGR